MKSKFENRAYIRYAVAGDVAFKTTKDPTHKIYAELIDLSYLGFSVYLKEKIEEGTDVEFEINFYVLYQSLIGKGKVQHVAETQRYLKTYYRTGIEFTDVNKDFVLSILNEILAKRANKAKEASQNKTEYFGPI